MREVGNGEGHTDYVSWDIHLQGYRATASTDTFILKAVKLVSCYCTFDT